MPVVTLTVGRVLSAEQKQLYGETVHAAMVATLNVPVQDKMIRIIELSADNFLVNGFTDNVLLLELSLFPGRSIDSKRAFYRTVVEQFTQFGIPATDIRIILHEISPENWGLRGGVAGCDLKK